MKWIKKLLKEEKAQGAIEYILLAGGIIVAAVVVFAVYKRMASTTSTQVENQTNKTVKCAYLNQTECNSNPECYWDSNLQACMPA